MADNKIVMAAKDGSFIRVRTVRKDGWTPRRRRIFLEHLSATCNVRFSARAAEMTDTGAYALRQRDQQFREDWAAAIEQGYARLEAMLMARAGGTSRMVGPAGEPIESGNFDGAAHLDISEEMDSQLALQMMALHRRAARGGPDKRRTSRTLRRASPEEMAAAILRQLSVLNKRQGGEG